MPEEYKRIASLIMKLRHNTASPAEKAEIEAWGARSDANRQLLRDFLDKEWVTNQIQAFEAPDWKGHWRQLAVSIPALQRINTDSLPLIQEPGEKSGMTGRGLVQEPGEKSGMRRPGPGMPVGSQEQQPLPVPGMQEMLGQGAGEPEDGAGMKREMGAEVQGLTGRGAGDAGGSGMTREGPGPGPGQGADGSPVMGYGPGEDMGGPGVTRQGPGPGQVADGPGGTETPAEELTGAGLTGRGSTYDQLSPETRIPTRLDLRTSELPKRAEPKFLQQWILRIMMVLAMLLLLYRIWQNLR